MISWHGGSNDPTNSGGRRSRSEPAVLRDYSYVTTEGRAGAATNAIDESGNFIQGRAYWRQASGLVLLQSLMLQDTKLRPVALET
eukprot:747022-Hanusia_phi.AAC.2